MKMNKQKDKREKDRQQKWQEALKAEDYNSLYQKFYIKIMKMNK